MIISNFLGIRNTSPIRSIPNNALIDAIDVDIDDVGVLTQRNGYELVKSLASATSAYATFDQTGYIVANGILNRLDADLNLIPLTPSTAINFADFGKVLFTNDGLKIQDDHVKDLKIPVPDTALSLSIAAGDWPAGDYAAMYCYRNTSTGLEGPSSEAASITIPMNSTVIIAPVPSVAGYTPVVYMTEAGGSVFYDSNGIQLNPTQILANSFPFGVTHVAFFDTRLFIALPLANGSTILRYSAPFEHHLFDYVNDYVIIPGEIRALMPAQDALIIGTDCAIHAYSGSLTRLADYGVPRGRAFTKAPDSSVKMFTNRGVCTALPFENLTEKKALFAPGQQCSTALVLQDGIQKFVTLSDGSGAPYNTRS
jgi:hypothetical protein